ncbi:MAG: hypothetical protein GF317_00030 [Candidatus Lokiarchaeota archaeon]|nr:hypothetical protein [Candidatus Lokiarchaeota archaeon]MBD3198374.1 hypothetical protein [Candidatus Lokiarchaeota archaeon]
MTVGSHEDIYFYLDLARDYLKKKDLIKILQEYIIEKDRINKNGLYGFLIFDENGLPNFIGDLKEFEKISDFINNNWESRAKEKSYFEKGLFMILSHIAKSIRKRSVNNRIIIISDIPSKLSNDYQEALINLVSKVKFFPTFIDIIRVSKEKQRFFDDEVKLNILVSDTRGGIFFAQNKKELKEIFGRLLNNKTLVNTFTDKPDEIELKREDLLFYKNLAKTLVEPQEKENLKCQICSKQICPICNDSLDIPMGCENCGTTYHNCCILNYSLEHNIGIPSIFRCPECSNLLQLEEKEIEITQKESIHLDSTRSPPSEDDIIIEQPEIHLEKVKVPKPMDVAKKVNQTRQKIEIPEKSNDYLSKENQKVVRVGGFFGKTYIIKEKGQKVVYQDANLQKSQNKVNREAPRPSIPKEGKYQDKSLDARDNNQNGEKYWKPPKLDKEINKSSKITSSSYRICPVCGAILSSEEVNRCDQCGSKI